MTPILQINDLKTHFFTKAGVLKAVDGVSLEIGAGEIVGLVGESGSGKSITGFSIIGLVDAPGRIVDGEILFKGQNLTNLSPQEMQQFRGNRVAMIFQDPMMTLNPVLRIETQMIEAIQAHDPSISRTDAHARSRDALGLVGISSPEERIRAYPHQFSGCMRQRVSIAIAMLKIRSCGIDKDFCQANAIKYLARFGKKDGRNRADLLKAAHYIVLLMDSEDNSNPKEK